MKFHNDILSLVGKTPLVRINKLTKQHKIKQMLNLPLKRKETKSVQQQLQQRIHQ